MTPVQSAWRAMKVLGWFTALVLRPGRVDKLIQPGNRPAHPAHYALQVQKTRSLAGVAAFFDGRVHDEIPAIEALAGCPRASLGRALHDHFTGHGIDPSVFKDVSVVDDASYVIQRCRETHDVVHVLLGADTSIGGEIFVQGFVYAQTHARIGPLALAVSIVHTFLRRPDAVPDLIAGFFRGYQIGKAAKPFLAVRYTERWRDGLADVRADLAIVL